MTWPIFRKNPEELSQTCLRGSISLEAAVLLPLILIFFFFLLSAELSALGESQLRYALDQVGTEISLLFPAAEKAMEKGGELGKQILKKTLDQKDAGLLESMAGDYASSLFLSPFLERRLDMWISEKRRGGGLPLPPHERQLFLDWSPDGKGLTLTLWYSTPLLIGRVERELKAFVPLWSERVPEKNKENESQESSQDDDIWSADNFSRGRYFRNKMGSNLPANYPTIAAFDEGRAKAVRSMDLTAPAYADVSTARQNILLEMEQLAAFRGHSSRSNKVPTIREEEIQSRELVIITPRNSPGSYDAGFWNEMKREASARGLYLDLRQIGRSHRYLNEGEEAFDP